MPATTAVKSFGNYINGEWVEEEKVFSSINPADRSDIVGQFQSSSEETAKRHLMQQGMHFVPGPIHRLPSALPY